MSDRCPECLGNGDVGTYQLGMNPCLRCGGTGQVAVAFQKQKLSNPKHQEVLDICASRLDPGVLEVIRSALASDERMAVIRDAFLEGRDHEAVTLLSDLDNTRYLQKAVGFSSSGVITPASSVQVVVRPQIPFRGCRLLVSLNCCLDFTIDDVRVGYNSQFVQSGSIPADLFGVSLEDVWRMAPDDQGFWAVKPSQRLDRMGIAIDMPWCQVGQDLVVQATNISGSARTLRGAFLGVIRPDGGMPLDWMPPADA